MRDTHEVTYRNMKSDQSKTIQFPSCSAAVKWAREFVRQSYRNEAAAVVSEIGNCMNYARFDNINGKAERS